MDPFQLLETDHQRVSTLFKNIESASGPKKRGLFERLHQELDLHANLEETIFYPSLEDTDEAREIILEAYEEHKVVKELLSELASGDENDEEWTAKLTVLKENVEHHVEEEEGELFRKARAALSKDQIETLGEEMQSARGLSGEGVAASTSNNRASKKEDTAKSAGNRGRRRRGLVGTLAGLVGLGSTPASEARRTSRTYAKKSGSKKKSTKARSAGGQNKSAAKSDPSKKSTVRSTSKSGKQSAAKKKPAKKAARKSKSKSSNRKSTVASRSSAQKAARASGKKSRKGTKKSGGAKQRRRR